MVTCVVSTLAKPVVKDQVEVDMQRYIPTGKIPVGVVDVSAEAHELGTEKASKPSDGDMMELQIICVCRTMRNALVPAGHQWSTILPCS